MREAAGASVTRRACLQATGEALSKSTGSQPATLKSEVLLFPQPALQLIYDTAPIGLACLSPDCRYLRSTSALPKSAASLLAVVAFGAGPFCRRALPRDRG